jgi:hypothetical protein
VLEAHFGVGFMDFETLHFAQAHGIHPVGFSSTSENSTDLAGYSPTLGAVAKAHAASTTQVLCSVHTAVCRLPPHRLTPAALWRH